MMVEGLAESSGLSTASMFMYPVDELSTKACHARVEAAREGDETRELRHKKKRF